jgi:hypothetical protein
MTVFFPAPLTSGHYPSKSIDYTNYLAVSGMLELESGCNATIDRLQMLPDGLDAPVLLIFAFCRLGQPDDLERKIRHQQLLGPMLARAVAKMRAITRRSKK